MSVTVSGAAVNSRGGGNRVEVDPLASAKHKEAQAKAHPKRRTDRKEAERLDLLDGLQFPSLGEATSSGACPRPFCGNWDEGISLEVSCSYLPVWLGDPALPTSRAVSRGYSRGTVFGPLCRTSHLNDGVAVSIEVRGNDLPEDYQTHHRSDDWVEIWLIVWKASPTAKGKAAEAKELGAPYCNEVFGSRTSSQTSNP